MCLGVDFQKVLDRFYCKGFYLSIYLCIYLSVCIFDLLLFLEHPPRWVAVTELPSFPIQILLSCLFELVIFSNTSITHVLFDLILPHSKWPSFSIDIFSFAHIHFLYKFFTLYPLSMAVPWIMVCLEMVWARSYIVKSNEKFLCEQQKVYEDGKQWE